MHFLNLILNMIHRMRHPASLPSDVATDLGLGIYSRLPLMELLKLIQSPTFKTDKLKKFMRKEIADGVFKHAARKDIFQFTSRFSYLFGQGVLEFVLHFDTEGRLRRAYVHFQETQIELELDTAMFYTLTENLSQQ